MNPPEREPRPNDAADPRTGEGDENLVDDRVEAHRMRLVGRLAPGVAHEIGNPLAAIVAFGQLIRNDPRLPEDMQRDAALLVEAAEQTRSLIAGFLDLVRARPPERHPTRVAALVDSVVALSAYRLSSARASVAVDIAEDVPRVPIDRPRMQQVLLALVDAAAAPGGRVAIRGRGAPSGRVRLTIAPAAPLPDGAVVAEIVERQGGRLDVTADAFQIELPAVASDESKSAPAAAPAPAPAAAASRSSVLVIDDDIAMRTLLGRALGRAGYDVIVAASPTEASTAAAAGGGRIGAVLCDHHLGPASGIDACTTILAAHPELQGHVALMSADLDDATLRAYAESNAIRLLAKPFDIATVVDFVRRLAE
ncbi:MAG: response regulator [Chloroflexota bacterium]